MSRTAPALLLSVVYAAALAIALTDLGQHAAAGLLLLGWLTARFCLRHRRATAPARVIPGLAVASPALAVPSGPVAGGPLRPVEVAPARAA